MKLTVTNKDIATAAKKYCRLVITKDSPATHRLVETKDGHLEYRLGVGKWSEVTPRKFRTLLRTIVQAAKVHQIETLALSLSDLSFPKLKQYGNDWMVQTMAENFLLAGYEFSNYKSDHKTRGLKEILVCGEMTKSQTESFKRGQIIAEATNMTRDIANTPGDDMGPSQLAEAAKKAAKGTKVKVTILDARKIKALKMGLLEAVGKGANDAPRFIVMEYFAGKKSEQPLVLIGKGITYDTGGLNMKPVGGLGAMQDMHMDMSGGAAVIGAIVGIAKLGLKQNVISLIPAAENAVSDRAMRAGDIVTSMSGKTVEVLHTDAEGRMVLADAYTYAQKFYKPKVIIDCATLTGAALVALGQQASALMTTDEKLQQQLVALGEETGDLVWPLPLWEEYAEGLKGDRGDYTNLHKGYARWGGAIEGGMFLSFFAPKDAPWAHIDMAPRMSSVPSDKLAKGATGEPVRLLIKFAQLTK